MFEHDKIENFHVTDAEDDALERLQKRLDIEILRTGRRDELRSFQYVGVVNLGKRAVQILPKIYTEKADQSKEERARLATRNLLSLLDYAGELKIYEPDIAPLIARDLHWLEILISLFAKHLLQEWRRGAIKSYQSIDDDLPVIRGKLRLKDQLREPARNHIFAVTYDELSADNKMNQVLRFVVEKLYRLSQNDENKQQLLLLRHLMSEVTSLPKVTYEDAKSIPINRLNKRYEPILNMARLFLSDKSSQLAVGEQESFAFVFDMNKLFEAFVVNFIHRHRKQILPPKLQGCALLPQSRGYTMALAVRNGKDVMHARPDLVFKQNDHFPLILDAKYKVVTKISEQLSTSDFDKMFKYSHGFQCKQVLVVYPQTSHLTLKKLDSYKLKSLESTISMAIVDLRVDIDSPTGKTQLINEFKNMLGSLTL